MGALYEQLARTLKEQIDAGTYGPGDWLPSEREISEVHSVSRNTVRLALQSLVTDGAVEVRPGRGYLVPAPDRPDSSSRQIDRVWSAIEQIEKRLERLEQKQRDGR